MVECFCKINLGESMGRLSFVVSSLVLGSSLMASTAELESYLKKNPTLKISGEFASYDFNGNGKLEANDWTFKFVGVKGVYRLLGKEASDKNVFGWQPVDVVPNKPLFYMVSLGDWDGDKRFD